ncbi:hypothetical protein J6T21_00885 [Candidatus Saccharibacteria bacterium]|nr:hypothetical protein [Candidatus Saccharibacteria bacterium]
MKKQIVVGWSGGVSSLFLEMKNGQPHLLSYEADHEKIHELCGGKLYYKSCSGASGEGYINGLGQLVELGLYRDNITYNNEIWFKTVGTARSKGGITEDIQVAVPYGSQFALKDSPVAIKHGNTLVYCDFYSNFVDILKAIMTCEELPEEYEADGRRDYRRGHHTITRTFSKLSDDGATVLEEEVTLEFYNLSSSSCAPNPWSFYSYNLREFTATISRETMYRLLSVAELGKSIVRTIKIDGITYCGEVLPGDPLETGHLTVGWQHKAKDILVRFYDGSNEAHLIAYAKNSEVRKRLAQRIAYRMNEGQEFIDFIMNDDARKYTEYEVVVPKTLYVLDEAAQLAAVRKELAKNIREDVKYSLQKWIERINEKAVLDAIPDDLIVTIDDSLEAGNCYPGTASFVARYFPGKTSTTAKELKEYSDDYYVMRLFNYLVGKYRFSCKQTYSCQ